MSDAEIDGHSHVSNPDSKHAYFMKQALLMVTVSIASVLTGIVTHNYPRENGPSRRVKRLWDVSWYMTTE